jgi:pimeloyl-ACP methyl ester carboxylesterase
MSKIIRLAIISIMVLALIPVSTVQANPSTPANCVPFDNPANTTEVYLICLPQNVSAWNGDLIVFAHGYMDPRLPVDIPYSELVLSDGTTIPSLVNNLNFAFATTSYSKNGLSVLEGVQNIRGLIQYFKSLYPAHKVFVVGASEGGLVATLLAEQYPTSINGSLSMCGPVGDFVKQVNYWDDFRVVFDYFFPGLLAPTAINIPASLPGQWSTYTTGTIGPYSNVPLEVPGTLQNNVMAAVYSAPATTLSQLLNVTKAPKSALDPVNTTWFSIRDMLWYNIMSTDQGRMELHHGPYTGNQGNPYNNKLPYRKYVGSKNDALLNAKVKRYTADPAALAEMAKYQTTGNLRIPLVNMHTTLDPIVPFWHQTLYSMKVRAKGDSANLTSISIGRYGHCSFYAEEMLLGFNRLLSKAGGPSMAAYLSALPNQASQERFKALVKELGSASSITVNDK